MEISSKTFDVLIKLRKILAQVPEMLVPSTCLTCNRFVDVQGGCCPQCWGQLRFVTKPLCPVMGSPFSIDMGDNFLSAEAIANPPPFDKLRAVLLYDDLARKLVSSIKYSDRADLLRWVANWMNVSGQEVIKEVDAIIPIPLHPSRLRARRFNQAGELAHRLAEINDKEFLYEVLIRKKHTRQQVGLSENERARNVSGAFIVPQEMKINLKGKRVLLIDDVYTTGATAKAATRALKRGGASQINVLVFAKVETHTV